MVLNTQCYQYLWLTMLFHRKKVPSEMSLCKVPKICNIDLWIENDPSPFYFSENSSNLVARPFPYQQLYKHFEHEYCDQHHHHHHRLAILTGQKNWKGRAAQTSSVPSRRSAGKEGLLQCSVPPLHCFFL